MEHDILNPRRPYKTFRPRQASRGGKAVGTATNYATVSLYNNSTGPYVLVVRHWMMNGAANANIAASYQQGQIGSSQGLVTPMIPSEATQAGLIASIDTATQYPGDTGIALAAAGEAEWYHEFPFAFIPPKWSQVWQTTTIGQALTVVAVWEAILIDELDYFVKWRN